MTNIRDKNRERQRAWRAENPGRLWNDDRRFTGVDGEGGTTVTGSHDYFLLRAGENVLTKTDGALSSWDCLDFLSGLSPRYLYVSYFFDYDVTKICQDLPWEKLRRLVHREERIPTGGELRPAGGTPWPVDVHGGDFQIDYLPRKFFKVRRQVAQGVWSPWIEISDVGTFFQCAFVKTLDRWEIGTDAQREAVAAGKALRGTFDAKDIQDIDRYNLLECRLLAETMERFRETCRRSGYVPRKWQGPGQIAEAVFKARGIPKSRKVPLLNDPAYEGLLRFAANSFYGGRPEITRVGPYFKPAWQYDVNSAYPYAMLFLPCLIHGEWEHGTGYKPGDTAIVYGGFRRKDGTRAYLFGFPVRRGDGSIYYPGQGKGWYWSHEIDAASHQVFTPEESYTYRKRCDCSPFSYIHGLYEMRIRLGKDALGLYLKLALNSQYGKYAQSIGHPAYANPIYASFITSWTRAQIQNMIHRMPSHRAGECGKDVLMICTDAIFTTRPLPGAEDSKELGGISVTPHPEGLLIIQPGLYFTGDGSKPKTRGVPQNAVQEREQEFLTAWQAMCDSGKESDGTVEIPVNVFVGLRQGIHRNRPDLLGTWIEYREDGTANGKRVGFDWRTKREAAFRNPGYGAVLTWPYQGGPDVETVPYSREIGRWRSLMRLDLEDQPDWVPVIGMEDM